MYNCRICNNYNSEKLKYGFAQHLSLGHKIKCLDYFIEYENFIIPKCRCGKNAVCRSGLSFNATCGDRICKSVNFSASQKKNFTDKPHLKETLRQHRLKYMKENPNSTAWRLRNNPSFPEKFFIEGIKRFHIDKKYEIIREYSVFPFFIDFAFIQIKVAVEVDGKQHQLENRKSKDIEKDKLLNSHGWRVYRIPADKLYSLEDSDLVIMDFLKFINDSKNESYATCGIKTHKELKLARDKVNNETIKLAKERKKLDQYKLLSLINYNNSSWKNEASIILGIKPHSVTRFIKREFKEVFAKIKDFRFKNLSI